jgi:hypothetical protein
MQIYTTVTGTFYGQSAEIRPSFYGVNLVTQYDINVVGYIFPFLLADILVLLTPPPWSGVTLNQRKSALFRLSNNSVSCRF